MSPTETIGTKPKASQPRSVRSKNHALMEDASIHPMLEGTAFLGNGRQKHSLKAVEYRPPPGQASRPEEGAEVALYEGLADPPHLKPGPRSPRRRAGRFASGGGPQIPARGVRRGADLKPGVRLRGAGRFEERARLGGRRPRRVPRVARGRDQRLATRHVRPGLASGATQTMEGTGQSAKTVQPITAACVSGELVPDCQRRALRPSSAGNLCWGDAGR
jgi:hypothetical protein